MMTRLIFVFLSFFAQESATRPPATYPIAGIVVDAVTGAPVPRAELWTFVQNEEMRTTAAENGRFRFTALEAGKYRLYAEAQGYVGEGYNQHGAFLTGIAVGAGLESEHLVFRLRPQAVIHGRVTDDHGDPVRQALVQLFATSNARGRRARGVQSQAQTDDLGEYRFAHLPAGKYYVAVQAHPWYAQTGITNRNEPAQSGPSFRRIDVKLDPILDVVYPVTFYPGALSERSATELSVAAGSREEANIQLQAVPSVHVVLTNLPVDEKNSNNVAIGANQKIFGWLAVGLSSVSAQISPGEYEIAGLPPGEITFTIYQGANPQEASRMFSANVSGDNTLDVAASMAASANVAGRVIQQSANADMGQAELTLAGEDNRTASTRLRKDGTFSFASLQAGTYKPYISFPHGAQYVQQLAASGAKVHGRQVTLDGVHEAQLTITLARGVGQLTGTAQLDGKPRAGAMVLLVPEFGENIEDDSRMDQSDSDGTFAISGILPGKYLLMAIDDGWDLEWFNPAVLNPFRENAQMFEIVPDGSTKATVNVQRSGKGNLR
ncbi:MAG TPA: carboxypeptidase-like regulatory domain-containing protein [Candidatus Acidoferrum sp.]